MKERTHKYVCFSLAGDLFVAPLSSVAEVYQVDQPLEVENLSAEVIGSCTVGEKTIPLINLHAITRRPRYQSQSQETCIVVFHLSDGYWGALVDTLEGIIAADPKNILSYAEVNSPVRGKLVEIQRSYLLIDPEKLVSQIEKVKRSSLQLPVGYSKAV